MNILWILTMNKKNKCPTDEEPSDICLKNVLLRQIAIGTASGSMGQT